MSNRLTTQPLPGLIRQIALPASIGFFFNTMFNVVDTFYAGLVSAQAVAALPLLIFPLFTGMVFDSIFGIWWGIFLINWSAAIITWFYLRRQLSLLPK